MSIYVNNQFRIKRNAEYQSDMVKLRDAKVFDGYKDILMISAIIGYANKRYIPIEKAASDGVLMQFFSEKDYDIMDLIAYAHKQEQSIIKSDAKYEIFSNYANGGFPILLEKLGVEKGMELNEESGRKMMERYLELLLSNDIFIEKIKVDDEDFFI